MQESKLNKEKVSNTFGEGFPVYESREALEEARLREAINRTDTEKFRLFTTMMRLNMMMKRAKITYQPE